MWKKLFGRAPKPMLTPLLDTRHISPESAPLALIITSEKKNQNYYRDLELARQTRAVLLTESFDFDRFDHRIEQISDHFFPETPPDFLFINYLRFYTYKLSGFEKLNRPIIGFVGDHHDFFGGTEAHDRKVVFFKSLPLTVMVTAYPHFNGEVAQALGKPELPFITLFWAIDPKIFQDLGKSRRWDIACLGSHTAGRYPFRNRVRDSMLAQSELRFFKKQRVCDHDGILFNRGLNKVRASFTCCLIHQYTLMKYFEIPASGALLFGERAPHLQELGFRDGINFVQVTQEDFEERFFHYLKGAGREQGEKIRLEGNRFVRETHTWQNRITGFLQDIKPFL